jgi:hypothetical protein
MLTLTKNQQRELNAAIARMPILGADYGARCISALYRSALRESQKRELLALAIKHDVTASPDWII